MKNKSMLLALGASLSLGLANVASAQNGTPFQAEKLNSGYSNLQDSVKLANGKCGSGKCGAGKCGAGKCGNSTDKKSKEPTGKCGSGKCGATKDKQGGGKCGSGKCGAKS